MHEEIYTMACTAAAAGEEEKAMLDALCAAAEAELTALLRPGISVEDCPDAFRCAAALLAAGRLQSCRQAGGGEQFTVGEVSIRQNSTAAESSGTMIRAARDIMAPYCRDSGFAFLGVQG